MSGSHAVNDDTLRARQKGTLADLEVPPMFRLKGGKALQGFELPIDEVEQRGMSVQFVRIGSSAQARACLERATCNSEEFNIFPPRDTQTLMLDEPAAFPTVDKCFHVAVATVHLRRAPRNVP